MLLSCHVMSMFKLFFNLVDNDRNKIICRSYPRWSHFHAISLQLFFSCRAWYNPTAACPTWAATYTEQSSDPCTTSYFFLVLLEFLPDKHSHIQKLASYNIKKDISAADVQMEVFVSVHIKKQTNPPFQHPLLVPCSPRRPF